MTQRNFKLDLPRPDDKDFDIYDEYLKRMYQEMALEFMRTREEQARKMHLKSKIQGIIYVMKKLKDYG